MGGGVWSQRLRRSFEDSYELSLMDQYHDQYSACPPEERVTSRLTDSLKMEKVLRLERKSKGRMISFLFNFWKGEDQLLDTCAETLLSLLGCLQLPEHVTYFGCQKDTVCLPCAFLSMGGVYTK